MIWSSVVISYIFTLHFLMLCCLIYLWWVSDSANNCKWASASSSSSSFITIWVASVTRINNNTLASKWLTRRWIILFIPKQIFTTWMMIMIGCPITYSSLSNTIFLLFHAVIISSYRYSLGISCLWLNVIAISSSYLVRLAVHVTENTSNSENFINVLGRWARNFWKC